MKRIITSVIVLASSGILVYAGGNSPQRPADGRFAPRFLNYQGYLTDTLGDPVTNPSVSMTFAIFDAVSSGNQKWSENQSAISVDKGIFNVLLGGVIPIPDSIFKAGADRWLELSVGGQTLNPRTRIVSVPYAYSATYSDTALYAANSVPDYDWTYRITDTADTTLQMGGRWGLTRFGNTMIGNADSTHTNLGFSSTTGFPGQNYKYITIGGGYNNTARGPGATISGGFGNNEIVNGNGATIGGGYYNSSNHEYTTVSGGYGNNASQFGATISGGYGNNASSYCATISGGYQNVASTNDFTTVGGGRANMASSYAGTVGGGTYNTASASNATVSGGSYNTASAGYATVIGGYYNGNAGDYSAILGGYADTIAATGDYSYLFGINSNLTQDSTFMVDMPHIRFGTEAAGYEFPTTDGSSGQALVTNGSGQVSWSSTNDNDWTISGSNMYSAVSGNVGIGTTTPTAKLNVWNGNISVSNGGVYSNTGYWGDVLRTNWGNDLLLRSSYAGKGILFETNTGEKMRIDAAGNVGIGVTSPSAKLDIAGGVKVADGTQGAGKVFTSDGSGLGSWQAIPNDNDWSFRITDTADTTLQMGGRWGLARAGNVLHGTCDSTHVNFGVACTTGTSGQDYKYCTVGGGYMNTASGDFATVNGGRNNTASGLRASVGGGWGNNASNYEATVGGGTNNNAGGNQSVIAGGGYNITTGTSAAIGGGYGNNTGGPAATIAGGQYNTASGSFSTVAGGGYNKARGEYSIVAGGGSNNEADSNSAMGDWSAIGGGIRNIAAGTYAGIGGGYNNTASGYVGTVSGGSTNAASGYIATIGGGSENIASGPCAIVGGGSLNTASDTNATIGGGYRNQAAAKYSAILGGYADTIFAGASYSYLFGINSNLTQDSTFMVDLPHIRFGTEAAGYEFPTTDGSSGQALVTNGSGIVSWGTPSKHAAYTPSGSSDPSGKVGDISWDNEYVYVKTGTGWKRSALSSW